MQSKYPPSEFLDHKIAIIKLNNGVMAHTSLQDNTIYGLFMYNSKITKQVKILFWRLDFYASLINNKLYFR